MTDKRPELEHGGIESREGDVATLGDGVQWWLNGTQWARDEADALIVRDADRVARTRRAEAIRMHVAAGHVHVDPPLFVLGQLYMEHRRQRA